MSPPDPRTRQEPGGEPRLLSKSLDGTTSDTRQGTTDLAPCPRPRISSDPATAAAELREAMGADARRWALEVLADLGGALDLTLTLALARIPAQVDELVEGVSRERANGIRAEVEHVVPAVLAALMGGTS